MIKPTPGRVLYYFPDPAESVPQIGTDPLVCVLCGVVNASSVNVALFDSNGDSCGSRRNVPLIQDDEAKPDGSFCAWMPFQKGQAAKTDDLAPRIAKLEESIAELGHRLDLAGTTTAGNYILENLQVPPLVPVVAAPLETPATAEIAAPNEQPNPA